MSQSGWHSCFFKLLDELQLCVMLKKLLNLSVFSHLFLLCAPFPSLSAIQFNDANSISRYLARVAPALGLYGANMMEQTEVCVCVCVFIGLSVPFGDLVP